MLAVKLERTHSGTQEKREVGVPLLPIPHLTQYPLPFDAHLHASCFLRLLSRQSVTCLAHGCWERCRCLWKYFSFVVVVLLKGSEADGRCVDVGGAFCHPCGHLLKDPLLFACFLRRCSCTPSSQNEFDRTPSRINTIAMIARASTHDDPPRTYFPDRGST